MGSFLGKAGFINDQYPFRMSQVLDHVLQQIIPHLICRPLRTVDELLDTIGTGLLQGFGQLPTVFSFDWLQQPLQIGSKAAAGFAVGGGIG